GPAPQLPQSVSIILGVEHSSSTYSECESTRALLFACDEPTTGLHPADVDRLMTQLDALVDAANTVIVVEHDLQVVAGSDWVIDVGPGAGEDGGTMVAQGTPEVVARARRSRTAPFLAEFLAR